MNFAAFPATMLDRQSAAVEKVQTLLGVHDTSKCCKASGKATVSYCATSASRGSLPPLQCPGLDVIFGCYVFDVLGVHIDIQRIL
jgi:hypothetical protein